MSCSVCRIGPVYKVEIFIKTINKDMKIQAYKNKLKQEKRTQSNLLKRLLKEVSLALKMPESLYATVL